MTNKRPKNANELFPSKYLKADDLADGIQTMVIDFLDLEEFTDPKTKEAEEKPVLHFKDSKKSLILNKTNSETLTRQLGVDLDGWTGREIRLEVKKVESFGQMVDAIRVIA